MSETLPSREDTRSKQARQPKPLAELLENIRDFLRASYPDAEYASLTVKLPGRVPMAVIPVVPDS